MWMINHKILMQTKNIPCFRPMTVSWFTQQVSNPGWAPNDFCFKILANERYICGCVMEGTGYKGAD